MQKVGEQLPRSVTDLSAESAEHHLHNEEQKVWGSWVQMWWGLAVAVPVLRKSEHIKTHKKTQQLLQLTLARHGQQGKAILIAYCADRQHSHSLHNALPPLYSFVLDKTNVSTCKDSLDSVDAERGVLQRVAWQGYYAMQQVMWLCGYAAMRLCTKHGYIGKHSANC